MAIIHYYFDESGKMHDTPAISFAGVCVSQSGLQKFDEEWTKLLRHYGLKSLHMKEAYDLNINAGKALPAGRTHKETIAVLKSFADCINDYLEIGMISAWDVSGFKAIDSTVKEGIGNPNDPYHLAFTRVMMEITDYGLPDDSTSVICDEDMETAWHCFRQYKGLREADPDIRKKLISLSFASDESFPALQAADMVAFLGRREAWRRFYKRPYCLQPLFEYLTNAKGVGKAQWNSLFADEKMLKGLKPPK
jgi:hypothetical protein